MENKLYFVFLRENEFVIRETSPSGVIWPHTMFFFAYTNVSIVVKTHGPFIFSLELSDFYIMFISLKKSVIPET